MKFIFACLAAASALRVNDVATTWDDCNPHPGYEAGYHNPESDGGPAEHIGHYDRNVTAAPALERFGGPESGDDMFMWSMISNYALELAGADGTPTGQFVFKMPQAQMAAYEILDTHMGLKGKDADEYLGKYLGPTFEHFDTANYGYIEADRMSGFFRYLTGNMQIDLH